MACEPRGTDTERHDPWIASCCASVMVRARYQGSNPFDEDAAVRAWPFWSRVDGRVALSASALVVSAQAGVIIACAQFVRAFIPFKCKRAVEDGHESVLVDVLESPSFAVAPPLRQWRSARIVRFFRAPCLATALSSVVGRQDGWCIGWSPSSSSDHLESATEFVLLQCLSQLDCSYPAICNVFPTKAAPVFVDASPYGILSPAVFGGSISQGIVSNTVSDPAGAVVLALIDARCPPGSDGGAVFVHTAGKLSVVGMVLPPLRRSDGESVELCPVVPIRICLDAAGVLPTEFRELASVPVCGSSSIISEKHSTPAQLYRNVVMVRAGSVWGSGVVVSSGGLVVTNAHVVSAATSFGGVSVRLAGGTHVAADVLFVSPGNPDIALLQMSGHHTFPQLPIKWEGALQIGTDVFVVGYPLFGPSCTSLDATICRGSLSRSVDGTLIQSTAAVHRGNSGGLLVSASGLALGIVTSNARDTDGRVMPRLNFSVPFSAMTPLRYICESTKGRVTCEVIKPLIEAAGLGKPDLRVDSSWALRDIPDFMESRLESSEFARYFRDMRSKL
eukprot:Opistho-2@23738